MKKIGQTLLVSKQTPLLMCGGEVMSATSGGQITQLMLASHDSTQTSLAERDQAILEANFNKQLALQRYISLLFLNYRLNRSFIVDFMLLLRLVM